MKQILIVSTICLLPQLLYGFGSQAPAQAVDAQVICSDGTTQLLNGFSLNGSTDIVVYVKPERAKSKTNSEIVLEFNPRDNDAKKSLLSIKTMVFKNKSITYVYYDEKKNGNGNGTSTRHKFREVEIDGTPFLIADEGKFHGKDADKNPHTININIVEKVMITNVYTKGEKSGDECKIPVSK